MGSKIPSILYFEPSRVEGVKMLPRVKLGIYDSKSDTRALHENKYVRGDPKEMQCCWLG